VSPSPKLRRAHAKRCAHTVTVGILTRAHELKGTDTLRFSGRVGRDALSPGSYHAILLASNQAGPSHAVSLGFVVVR
jgi:hypothetical protein